MSCGISDQAGPFAYDPVEAEEVDALALSQDSLLLSHAQDELVQKVVQEGHSAFLSLEEASSHSPQHTLKLLNAEAEAPVAKTQAAGSQVFLGRQGTTLKNRMIARFGKLSICSQVARPEISLAVVQDLTPKSERLQQELEMRQSKMADVIAHVARAFDRGVEYLQTGQQVAIRYGSHDPDQTGLAYVASRDEKPIITWGYVLGSGQNKKVYLAVDAQTRRLQALSATLATVSKAASVQSADEEMGPELLKYCPLHPNIIPCRVIYDSTGAPTGFMVMPLAEEGNLARFLSSLDIHENPTDAALFIRLLQQGALGLNFLSEHGLIHGDIKLENFLVGLDEDNQPFVQVADLDGLRRVGYYQTHVVQEGRTLTRISPQTEWSIDDPVPDITLQDYDWRKDDVWSFGWMLYEKLTGQAPILSKLERARLAVESDAQAAWRESIVRNLEKALSSSSALGKAGIILAEACKLALEPTANRVSMNQLLHFMDQASACFTI